MLHCSDQSLDESDRSAVLHVRQISPKSTSHRATPSGTYCTTTGSLESLECCVEGGFWNMANKGLQSRSGHAETKLNLP